MLSLRIAIVAAAATISTGAMAQVVDGNYDAAYGAAKSTVTYLPGAPTGNFGTPTPFTDAVGYSIFLTSDANFVYGFLQANPAGGSSYSIPGANLYFDLNNAVSAGSDLGFEITNGRAFVPGAPGYSAGTAATPLAGLTYAVSADGNGIEFSIANSLFTGPIAGLNYSDPNNPFAGPFPTIGSTVQLRLSQSFGYSVAGGSTYGRARLGEVVLGGAPTAPVPEPASWAMMIGGFGLLGAAVRRRSAKIAFA